MLPHDWSAAVPAVLTAVLLLWAAGAALVVALVHGAARAERPPATTAARQLTAAEAEADELVRELRRRTQGA